MTTSGAVSPIARDSDKIAPVNIPGSATGKMTFLIVCHFVAPIPYEASLKCIGYGTNCFLACNDDNRKN